MPSNERRGDPPHQTTSESEDIQATYVRGFLRGLNARLDAVEKKVNLIESSNIRRRKLEQSEIPGDH